MQPEFNVMITPPMYQYRDSVEIVKPACRPGLEPPTAFSVPPTDNRRHFNATLTRWW